jgi:hypothetical protein
MRENRIAEMLKIARELARHGHRPQMIEAILMANGFREAPEFIDQPHIRTELQHIAEQARRETFEREIWKNEEPSGN